MPAPRDQPQRGLFDEPGLDVPPSAPAEPGRSGRRMDQPPVEPPKPSQPRESLESSERQAPSAKRSARGTHPAASPGLSSAESPPADAARRVLSVSEVTDEILDRMRDMGRLAVEGEISGLRIPGSGHAYFDLKDEGAVLPCAIWRSRLARAASFRLEEGMRVVCHGDLDVYKPRGKYNLIVQRVERRGIGELLARLEELKAELKQRGWFARSRALPALPRCIGVVTSRDGAAFQDFLRTRSVRWPLYPVRLAHCPVQGEGCAPMIARAIASMDASGVDVIVVARGGGSLEDLWGFNELPVAEAIWAARVPVVSGVGHETDVTLADLVADHRAHTPTDAAQLVIPDEQGLIATLERLQGYLEAGVDRHVERRASALERLARSRVLRRPEQLLIDRLRRVGDVGRRLFSAGSRRVERAWRVLSELEAGLARQSPVARLERLSARLAASGSRLTEAVREPLRRRTTRLDLVHRALEATSPLAVLGRGYSIMRRSDGSAVRRANEVAPGEIVETLLAEGRVHSEVKRASAPQGGERGELPERDDA